MLSYMYYSSPVSAQFWFILSAAIIYLAGVMAVTIFGNIPMNNTLEALQIESMSPEQMQSFRFGFERKWNSLNTVRTVCSSLSFILLIMACIQNSSK